MKNIFFFFRPLILIILLFLGLTGCFSVDENNADYKAALKELEKDYPDNSEIQPEETVKKAIPKMTEDEYLKYFQTEWDNVVLVKKDGISQYDTYLNELNSILTDMVTVLDPTDNPDLTKPTTKLNKLRLKFISGKKNKDATVNWLTYGQPHSEYDLQLACELILKENANDPESIDIASCKIIGQNAKGWVVKVKYRGKNSFGAEVLEIATFDVQWDYSQGIYVVAGIH